MRVKKKACKALGEAQLGHCKHGAGTMEPVSLSRRSMLVRGALLAMARATPAGLALGLAGCGGGGSTTASALAISAASQNTPTSMTPVALRTMGLDVTQPFTVTVALPSGQSQTVPVLSTRPDGTVVITAPLYIDATTGATGSTDLTVQIAQGGHTSNALPMSVLDMPSVASYGVAPGVISHNFFNYLILQSGQLLNRYQAESLLPGAPDTSTVRSVLAQRIVDTLEMRSNIDDIASGTQTAFQIGTTASGLSVEFTAASVDMLDRMIGLHLQAVGYLPNMAFQSVPQPSSLAQQAPGAQAAKALSSLDIAGLIDGLTKNSAVAAGLAGAAGAVPKSGTSYFDNVLSGIGAAASIVGLVADAPAIVAGAAVVGAAVGMVSAAEDAYNLYTGDPNASWEKLALDTASGVTAAFGGEVVGEAGSVVNEISTFAKQAGSTGTSGLALQGVGFISNAGLFGSNFVSQAGAGAQAIADAQPFGTANGTVAITNSQTGLLAGLPGVNLVDPVTGATLSTIADSDGNYSFEVPIGISGFNYGGLQVYSYDPITGLITSAVTSVDLSTLTSSGALQLPSLSGTCSDSDAGAPDSDDPDCD